MIVITSVGEHAIWSGTWSGRKLITAQKTYAVTLDEVVDVEQEKQRLHKELNQLENIWLGKKN